LYEESVSKRLGEPVVEQELTTVFDIAAVTPEYDSYDDDTPPDIDDIVAKVDYDPEGYDGYIAGHVLLPRGE
jgi:hypothetical protein